MAVDLAGIAMSTVDVPPAARVECCWVHLRRLGLKKSGFKPDPVHSLP